MLNSAVKVVVVVEKFDLWLKNLICGKKVICGWKFFIATSSVMQIILPLKSANLTQNLLLSLIKDSAAFRWKVFHRNSYIICLTKSQPGKQWLGNGSKQICYAANSIGRKKLLIIREMSMTADVRGTNKQLINYKGFYLEWFQKGSNNICLLQMSTTITNQISFAVDHLCKRLGLVVGALCSFVSRVTFFQSLNYSIHK